MDIALDVDVIKDNESLTRVIGEFSQQKDGPLFIALAGIHGNESAGINALKRVFEKLQNSNAPFNGAFTGVSGNLTAIKQGKRYIDVDFNRQWYPRKVKVIKATPEDKLDIHEDIQQKELLHLFENTKQKYYASLEDISSKQVIMMDLHTFSAHGGAYSIATHLGESKSYASKLSVPVITGLENVLRGTTMHYFNDMEMVSYCFEAGQHYDPFSVDVTEAAIWVSLEGVGCMAKEDIPDYDKYVAILQKIGEGLPSVVGFCYRHAITDEDEFEMVPGFKNFQPIAKGQLLAHDKYGEIYAPISGLMLMPLYQKQGVDGFFIVREEEG